MSFSRKLEQGFGPSTDATIYILRINLNHTQALKSLSQSVIKNVH